MTAQDEPTPETAPEAEAAPAEKPKPKRKPLPVWVNLVIVVLFIVVALGIGYLIWIVANTYKLGDQKMDYGNLRMVDKRMYQDALGTGSELLFDKKADKPARIRFLLRGNDRHPVSGASVVVIMIRNDGEQRASAKADLKMQEPGVYRGEIDIPGGSSWEARVQVSEGGNAYQIAQRVSFPESDKEKAARLAKEAPKK